MIHRKAYKFKLKINATQAQKLAQFAGSCRYLWNLTLAEQLEKLEKSGKVDYYNTMAGKLPALKRQEETSFLAEAPSQVLQQTLKNLDQAFKDFFKKAKGKPRFKKKGKNDSFKFPQGFERDEGNGRIRLDGTPKT